MRRALVVSSLALVVTLGAAEVLVRTLTDTRPWIFFGQRLEEWGVPLMHEPHDELGWISRADTFRFPLGHLIGEPEREELVVTIGDDLGRATAAPGAPRGDQRVVFIGCSFTFGWAVQDDETFVWKVQEALPEIDALNLGTGGYGSLQSLLRIERYFELAEGPLPALVVYGLIGGHGNRDVAEYSWQRMMSMEGSHVVPVPRATVDDEGRLVRLGTQAYPVWPLGTHSAFVAWAADRYARARARGREEEAQFVHAAVVREMHEVVEAAGSRLLVVLLELSDERTEFFGGQFEAAGIDVVSCRDARSGRPEYRVPVDGHPNPALHAIWAECIAPAVAERL